MDILIRDLSKEEKKKLRVFKAKNQYSSWKEMVLDLVEEED